MEHIRISINIIILMLGTASAFYAWHVVRTYTYAFLRPIVHFIIFCNLIIFIDLTAQYSCINLLRDCLLYQSTVYARIFGPLSSFFFMLMTISLIRIVFILQEKRISSGLRPWLWAGFFLFTLSYVVRIILSLTGIFPRWLPTGQVTLLMSAIIVSFTFLLILLIQPSKINDANKRKIILPFGIFYLAVYTLLILSTQIGTPIIKMVAVSTVFFCCNLFPIFWFRKFFLPYHYNTVSLIEENAVLDSLYKKHQVSKREREIVDLILQGKSNKEIESDLFISLSTVKNHVYNVYQKLGVKSRSQLIRFILETQRIDRDLIMNG